MCKTTSFRLFFDYNYATQMRHAAFSILPPFSILFEFSVHSASVYLAKMSSDESSDSEMPYDSSDEEVWEEEEVSGAETMTVTADLDFKIQLDGTLSLVCKLSLPFRI